MSDFGLQVFDATGTVVVFDSNQVVGSVCLGVYTVPAGGAVYTFPDFPGKQGRFIYAGPIPAEAPYTLDSDLGYPRFTFGGTYAFGVVLFVF